MGGAGGGYEKGSVDLVMCRVEADETSCQEINLH